MRMPCQERRVAALVLLVPTLQPWVGGWYKVYTLVSVSALTQALTE